MLLEWANNSGKLQIITRKFQNSGKFQNNAINDVKQISLSHVIKVLTPDTISFFEVPLIAPVIASTTLYIEQIQFVLLIRNYWIHHKLHSFQMRSEKTIYKFLIEKTALGILLVFNHTNVLKL